MRIKKERFTFWVFLGLSIIIMGNLNGVLGVYLGINAPFSPVILVLAIALIVLSKPKYSDFNLPMKFLLIFFGTFWFIGLNVSLIQFLGFKAIINSTRAVFTSAILITSYYVYFKQLKRTDAHLYALFYIFFVTCLGGVLESVLGLRSIYVEEDVNRSLGFFGNPNETGLQCNITLLFTLYLFLKRKIGFIALFLGMSIGVYGSIISFSKSAMLITIIILFGYFMYNILYFTKLGVFGIKRFGKLIVIISAIMVFFVGPSLINQLNNLSYTQFKRIEDLYKMMVLLQFDRSTTSDRTIAIEQGLEVYIKRPVFGHGLNSFSQGDLFKLGLGVHNSYLKILGEGGAVSFLLWLIFLASYFIFVFKSTQIPDSFFVVGVIIIISIYFMVSHTVMSRKFVVPLLGIAMTMMHYRKYKIVQLEQ